jgi:hypothetical protein
VEKILSDEWMSASEAYAYLDGSMDEGLVTRTICKRCFDGLIRSRTEKFIKHREVLENVELPPEFWWAKGEAALTQNWSVGDFETWIDDHYHWRAYGVEFYEAHIEKIVPPPIEKQSNLDKAILRPDGVPLDRCRL